MVLFVIGLLQPRADFRNHQLGEEGPKTLTMMRTGHHTKTSHVRQFAGPPFTLYIIIITSGTHDWQIQIQTKKSYLLVLLKQR